MNQTSPCWQGGLPEGWLLVTVDRLPPDAPCSMAPCAGELWQEGAALQSTDPERAEELMRQAYDASLPSSRATTAIQDIVRDAASRDAVLLVDTDRALLHGRVTDPAASLFTDGLHFSPEGHAAMAELLAGALAERPELR